MFHVSVATITRVTRGETYCGAELLHQADEVRPAISPVPETEPQGERWEPPAIGDGGAMAEAGPTGAFDRPKPARNEDHHI